MSEKLEDQNYKDTGELFSDIEFQQIFVPGPNIQFSAESGTPEENIIAISGRDWSDEIETLEEKKQDNLIAGDYISINQDNQISVTGLDNRNNSWKQYSEDNESEGKGIYIGEENIVSENSIAIGNENEILKSDGITIGNDNINGEADSYSNSIILGSNNTAKSNVSENIFKDEELTAKPYNFIVGFANSAKNKNSYALGSYNIVGTETETIASAEDNNNGFAFAYGYANTATRNYDMAIGYRSFASGGENLSFGHSNVKGYKNIAFNNSNITGADNFLYKTTFPITNNIGYYSHNFAINTNLNSNDELNAHQNILFNIDITNLNSAAYFERNIITYGTFYIDCDVVTNNRLLGSNNLYISGHDFSRNDISNSLVTTNKIYLFTDNDISKNSHVDIKSNTTYETNTASNNILFNDAHLYNNDNFGMVYSQNIICNNSQLHSTSSNITLSRNIILNRSCISASETTCDNMLFGTIGKNINGVFSFTPGYALESEDPSQPSQQYPQQAIIYNSTNIRNFGDNAVYKSENVDVFGQQNILSGVQKVYMFGYSNSAYATDNYYKAMDDTLIFGDYNIISAKSNNVDRVTKNLILGCSNSAYMDISGDNTMSDNKIIGNYHYIIVNSANFDDNTISGCNNTATIIGSGYSRISNNIINGQGNNVYYSAEYVDSNKVYGCYNSVRYYNQNNSTASYCHNIIYGNNNDVYLQGYYIDNVNILGYNNKLTATDNNYNNISNVLITGYGNRAYLSNTKLSNLKIYGVENDVNLTNNNSYNYIDTIYINGYENDIDVHAYQANNIFILGSYTTANFSNNSYTNSYIYSVGSNNKIVSYTNTGNINNNYILGSYNNIQHANVINGQQSDVNFNYIFGCNNGLVEENNIDPSGSSVPISDVCRTYTFGSDNAIHTRMNDIYILGHSTRFIKTNSAWWSSDIFVNGYANSSYDGSLQVLVGEYNTASGHFAYSLGLQNIANEHQTVIGRYNVSSEGSNRFKYFYNGTDSQGNPILIENEALTTGILFTIGNGYINGYEIKSSSDGKASLYDVNGNEFYSETTPSAIVRSNALTVSANGVVSAAGYIGDVSATNITLNNTNITNNLETLLGLIQNRPTTGTYTLGCENGTLKWILLGEDE